MEVAKCSIQYDVRVRIVLCLEQTFLCILYIYYCIDLSKICKTIWVGIVLISILVYLNLELLYQVNWLTRWLYVWSVCPAHIVLIWFSFLGSRIFVSFKPYLCNDLVQNPLFIFSVCTAFMACKNVEDFCLSAMAHAQTVLAGYMLLLISIAKATNFR